MFMLGEDPGQQRYVYAVSRRSGGLVITPSPDDLGRNLVADYIKARRGRRRAA
jgi:uncharacterized protein with von Willebrand factor type A (vWA) domain